MNSKTKTRIVVFYFATLLVLDLFNKEQAGAAPFLLTTIKTIKTAFVFLFISIVWNEKKWGIIKKITPLISLIFFQQWLLFSNHYTLFDSGLMYTIRELLLYCFPIIFLLFLFSINDSENLKVVQKCFQTMIWIIVITTILGFVFSISFFQTYYYRFGYIGILPKSITATYFYIAAISYSYSFFSKKIESKLLFICTLFSSLLVGTKGIYLFIALFFLYVFIVKKGYLKSVFYVALVSCLILIGIFRNSLLMFFKKTFSVVYDLYLNEGFFTSIMSLRNKNFHTISQKYEPYWHWYNYFIGGRITTFPIFELTIIDLFVSFGLFGASYYLYNMYFLISSPASRKSSFFNFSLSSIFIISIFAGQFFTNISAISYVIIAFFIINNATSINQLHES